MVSNELASTSQETIVAMKQREEMIRQQQWAFEADRQAQLIRNNYEGVE